MSNNRQYVRCGLRKKWIELQPKIELQPRAPESALFIREWHPSQYFCTATEMEIIPQPTAPPMALRVVMPVAMQVEFW